MMFQLHVHVHVQCTCSCIFLFCVYAKSSLPLLTASLTLVTPSQSPFCCLLLLPLPLSFLLFYCMLPSNPSITCLCMLQPFIGVNASQSALLYCIMSPVGPYFKKNKDDPSSVFSPVSLYADPKYIRAWPGGVGDTKIGG